MSEFSEAGRSLGDLECLKVEEVEAEVDVEIGGRDVRRPHLQPNLATRVHPRERLGGSRGREDVRSYCESTSEEKKRVVSSMMSAVREGKGMGE